MMTVSRIRGKIVRNVPCCIVYFNSAQWYAHIYEQFLQLIVGLGLPTGLLFVCFFSDLITAILFSSCLLVVLGGFSVLRKVTVWEENQQTDLFCVEWASKP